MQVVKAVPLPKNHEFLCKKSAILNFKEKIYFEKDEQFLINLNNLEEILKNN
jgi:hypothetical protein